MIEIAETNFGRGGSKPARMITASSAIEMLDWILAHHARLEPCSYRGVASVNHPATKTWDDNTGWDGACELIRKGWHKGAEKLTAAARNISLSAGEEPIGYKHDVIGQFFDVGLVLQGEPECWYETETVPARNTVAIDVNSSMLCNVTAQEAINRGGAIAAMIDRLQQEGWIVDISIYFSKNGHTTVSDKETQRITVVKIKPDARPLDIDELGFLLAHPAASRRMSFAAAEAMNGSESLGDYGKPDIRKIPDFMGYSAAQYNDFRRWCGLTGGEHDKRIDLMAPLSHGDPDFATEASAARWLQAQLEKLAQD